MRWTSHTNTTRGSNNTQQIQEIKQAHTKSYITDDIGNDHSSWVEVERGYRRWVGLSHDTGIIHTLAEMFIRGVVSEPSKLILHCLRKCRISNDRILSFFIGEIGIEIGNIKNRFLMVNNIRWGNSKMWWSRGLRRSVWKVAESSSPVSCCENHEEASPTEFKKGTYRFQSIYLAKNGCRLISSPPPAPRRLVGSRWRRPAMTLFASIDISGGKWRGSVRMRWYIVFTFSS